AGTDLDLQGDRPLAGELALDVLAHFVLLVGVGVRGQTQPVIRRPRPPRPPRGKPSPRKGTLDRSMSTLMPGSWVARRVALTSQVLRDGPLLAASASARALTDSGSRTVIRTTETSSPSGASGAGGGGGGGGAGAGDSTTKLRSRPASRTSTLPAGSSALISAAACEMASMRARRTDGSSA